jgi:hypothetical protein
MIEVHQVPSCVPVSGQYVKYINGVASAPTIISNIVFYEKEGMLEGNRIGIKYKVQISTTVLADKPSFLDYLIINGIKYKFINPQLKNQNIFFVPFWESEVKSVK